MRVIINHVPFGLPEYDEAFARFLKDAVHRVAMAGDPVLSQIQVEEQTTTVATRIQDRDGMLVDLPEQLVGFEAITSLDAVRSADYGELAAEVHKAAEELRTTLAGGFFEHLNTITEATGNVVDAAGGELTFELIYELLDTMEWSLTDEGELSIPSLVMSPEMVEKLKALETPETAAAMEELKRRKYEELVARRPRRRLS